MVEKFQVASLEQIGKLLGDTDNGFTGSEIESLFKASGIMDPGAITKWRRVSEGLEAQQLNDKCANNVIGFIEESMKPVRYLKAKEHFEHLRNDLNIILSLEGFAIDKSGKIKRTEQTFNLDDATQRANSLKRKLKERNTHSEVYRFCTAEILEENYFHAIFESSKGVAARLREKT